MRKYLLVIVLLILKSTAQNYYSVNDSDGYSNLRFEPNSKSKIIGKIKDSECVIGVYEIDNWIKILHFNLELKELRSGYVHKSRLKANDACKNKENVKSLPLGDVALEAIEKDKNIRYAFEWYQEYSSLIVDDGYYAEGYSDYIATTLSNSFESSIIELNTVASINPDFIKFVLRHINETASMDQIEKIRSYEDSCSDYGDTTICKKIINATRFENTDEVIEK